MASSPIPWWQIEREKVEAVMDFIFLGSKITVDSDCSHEIKQNKTKHLLLGRKCMIKPRQCIKKQRHHFADKGPNSQSYGFSSSHIWMWELDHEEDWVLKNWRLWIVALEARLFSSLKSPLDSRSSNQSILKEISPEYSLEAEASVLWLPVVKSWLIGKDPDSGKDWGQEEKGKTEDRMVGWLHWLNGHEFEPTPGDSERQKSLECWSLWGEKDLEMFQQLNNNNVAPYFYSVFLIISQIHQLNTYQNDTKRLPHQSRCP